MKITLEQAGYKTFVESDNEVIGDVLQDIIHALLGHGYQPQSIKDAICEKAEEYNA